MKIVKTFRVSWYVFCVYIVTMCCSDIHAMYMFKPHVLERDRKGYQHRSRRKSDHAMLISKPAFKGMDTQSRGE